MTLLKMKIHMQTLIGNVFGFQFKGLEASKTKLAANLELVVPASEAHNVSVPQDKQEAQIVG